MLRSALLLFFSATTLAQQANGHNAQDNRVTTPAHYNTSPEPISYEHMPPAVHLKMNANKASGHHVLHGIIKSYTAHVDACADEEATHDLLGFLNNINDLVGYRFVSKGVVKILVAPDFSSEELKETLHAHRVVFDLTDEQFLIAE